MLDERKTKVLYAIINSHLISAEPIGSRTISKEYDLGVSPATIRNEMSDLEDKGYLSKPHSSAGRIPSDKAYRLYVDEILKVERPKKDREIEEEIKKTLIEESKEIKGLMENAAKLLSRMTSYTALTMSPQINKSTLKHIQLMKIDSDKILMVVVNSSGLIKNSTFKTNIDLDESELLIISNYLNEKFKSLTIDEIIDKIQAEKLDEDQQIGFIIDGIFPEIKKALRDISEIDIYSEGITKILNYPEYNDIEKAKSFMNFIENKDSLINMLMRENDNCNEINILIGEENKDDAMKDCSVITANYSIDGNNIGKIGIIGPKRMEYFKVINILSNFSDDMTSVLNMLLK